MHTNTIFPFLCNRKILRKGNCAEPLKSVCKSKTGFSIPIEPLQIKFLPYIILNLKIKQMSKKILALSAVVMSVLFVSCKKENSNPSNAEINGTWNFASMETDGSVSQEYTDEFGTTKTINTYDFVSEDNKGTITFDGSKIVSSNLSYSVDYVLTAKTYQDGVLVGTSTLPINQSYPASSSTASYKMVGTDSIYFEGGSMFMGGVTTELIPSGAKLDLQGNTLFMTQYVNQTKTQDIFGIPITTAMNLKVVVKLQK